MLTPLTGPTNEANCIILFERTEATILAIGVEEEPEAIELVWTGTSVGNNFHSI